MDGIGVGGASEIATLPELKARWLYAEVLSPYFGPLHAAKGLHEHAELRRKIEAGAAFVDLSAAERGVLASALEARRGAYAAFYFGIAPNQGPYRRERWTRDEVLARLTTVHALGHLPFSEFVAASPPPDTPNDPRVRAAAWNGPFVQPEAGIAVHYEGRLLLLEGNGRAVAFLRLATPEQRYSVWVPDV